MKACVASLASVAFAAEQQSSRGFVRLRLAFALAVGGSLAAAAFAAGATPAAAPTKGAHSAPPAPVDSAALAAFDADTAHRELTEKYVTRARAALDQASQLRASGDTTRADRMDRVAATWAEAARNLVRAAESELRAANVQIDALDAGARAERERALLEESVATVGRKKAELARLEREKSEAPTRTTQTNNAAMDGGAASRTRGKDAGDDRDWANTAATAAPVPSSAPSPSSMPSVRP